MSKENNVTSMSAFMLPIFQIARRDLKSYFNSNSAWLILFFICLIDGMLGYWSIKKQLQSAKALHVIFYVFSGTTMIAGVLISMRTFAEERASGTLELLVTSPLNEMQLIVGKFLAAFSFLLILIAATFPMPLTVLIFGDASWGHLVAGYIGVVFIGSSSIAITLFYSTITSVQIMAAIMGGANVVFFLLLGFFSPYISEPMKSIIREFSLYVHYMDFERGVIVLKHIIFFLSVIAFYLALSNISLKIRRLK